MTAALAMLAIVGWSCALVLFLIRRRGGPMEAPTWALLMNKAGVAESVRKLRGNIPETYSRPHGSKPTTIYDRIGTAAVYKARS